MMSTRTAAETLRAILAGGTGYYVTSDPAGHDSPTAGPVATVGAPTITWDPAVCPGPMWTFPVYVAASGVDRAAVDALYDAVDAAAAAVSGSPVFTLTRATPAATSGAADRPPTYVVEVRV